MMQTHFDCVPCFVRQVAEAVALATEDAIVRESVMRRMLRKIAKAEWMGPPPVMGQNLHHSICDMTGNNDPYKEVRREMNRMASELIPRMREFLRDSPNCREDAVRVAIIGNLLDAGAKTQASTADFPRKLDEMLTRQLRGDVTALFQEAERASHILYLADNAGEIFFDRLLIEKLPYGKITVAVRGGPTINDAIMEDAESAGIPEITCVIDNGYDAPGTILKNSSLEFRRIFDQADLIIAKGQGNYETLSDCEKQIWFLLNVKCPLIANHIGEKMGSLVVKKSNF